MIETETGMSMRDTAGHMIGRGTEVGRGIGMTMTGTGETDREIGLVTGMTGMTSMIAIGGMTATGMTVSDLDHLPARAPHPLHLLPHPPLLPPHLPLPLPQLQHPLPPSLLQRV